jgi:hypothetical protein
MVAVEGRSSTLSSCAVALNDTSFEHALVAQRYSQSVTKALVVLAHAPRKRSKMMYQQPFAVAAAAVAVIDGIVYGVALLLLLLGLRQRTVAVGA